MGVEEMAGILHPRRVLVAPAPTGVRLLRRVIRVSLEGLKFLTERLRKVKLGHFNDGTAGPCGLRNQQVSVAFLFK